MKHRVHLLPKGSRPEEEEGETPGRWEEAFCFFAKGDIIRHDLTGAAQKALLRHAGHAVVDEEIMEECMRAHDHSKVHVLSRDYVFDFFRSYEAELAKATEVAFLGKAHFGAIQVRQLYDLIKQVGFMLSAGDFQELLEEAADAFNIPLPKTRGGGSVDFTLFCVLMESLAERDGFTRSQHGRLCAAFSRLDTNGDGVLQESELHALIVWLSFCAPEGAAEAAVEEARRLAKEIAEQEILLVPKEEARLALLQPSLNGQLSLSHFLQMMRRYFNAEYFRTQHLFRKMDSDKDGMLDVIELRSLFQRLGLDLTVQSLLEAVSFHHLGGTFSHSDFLLILEYLRDTEGLCEDQWSDARGSFSHFDYHGEGLISLISTRRAQSALEWNGYHLGMSVFGERSAWKDRMARGKVGEAEFLRVCREQDEAEMKITRTVFRKYADKTGSWPLRRENLQLALKMVNVRYDSFYPAWLKKQQELPKMLDFEDFREVVASFRQQTRDAYRTHSRFTQKEVKSLEESFRKLGPDRAGKLPHPKVAELFEALYPALKWDPHLRESMRGSLKLHDGTSKPLSLLAFLAVLRTFEDTCASALDEQAELVARDMDLSPAEVDDFLEAYHICRCKGPGGVRSVASNTLRKVLYRHNSEEQLTFQEEAGLYQALRELLGQPAPLRLEEFVRVARKLQQVPQSMLAARGKGSKVRANK